MHIPTMFSRLSLPSKEEVIQVAATLLLLAHIASATDNQPNTAPDYCGKDCVKGLDYLIKGGLIGIGGGVGIALLIAIFCCVYDRLKNKNQYQAIPTAPVAKLHTSSSRLN